MQQLDVFQYFKRQQSGDSFTRSLDKIFFQIAFDDSGAFVSVVDKNGKPADVSYLNFDGIERSILRTIEQAENRNSFVIDWENPTHQVYLDQYSHLLELLKSADNVVDANMRHISFAEEHGKVMLHLAQNEEKDLIESEVLLYHNGQKINDFKIINSTHLFCDHTIIPIPDLGSHYQGVPYFNTSFTSNELVVFLSLFFSNLENTDLLYEDYSVVFKDAFVTAKACIIFEKIDEDDTLFMRIGQVLPNIDVDTLDQLDLAKYAEVNEMERQISIKFIHQDPLQSITEEIYKLLRKHRPPKKEHPNLEIVQEGNLFIIPKEVVGGFIYKELPELLLKYQVMGAERLKSYKVSAIQPSLKLSLDHGIDFFEGEVNLDFDGELVDLFDVIKQYKKNRYVKLNDGTHALVNEQYLQKLERIFTREGKKAKVSFFDLPLVEEIIEEKVTHTAFQKSRDFYAELNEVGTQNKKLPKIKAKLRPYQRQGYQWLNHLNKYQLGGCLADDMGLGKTLQCIALLAKEYQKKQPPSLIVMPRSLLFNWEREVQRFAPQLSTSFLYGSNRELSESLKADLILTTYAIVRNDIKELKEIDFHYIVLDESQNIKNINAQTTKAVMLLNGTHRLALSGTPIENNLGELYSLFRFLNPSMFGTLTQFNQHYLAPIQKWGDPDAVRQLRKKIYPFVLRRLKKEVLQDLPDKIKQTLYVEMSEKQKKLYEKRRQFYKAAIDQQISEKGLTQSRFFVFQALNELRQIASIPEQVSEGKVDSPKLELLVENLFDAIANGHKALIFVNYLAAIESIGERLDEAGIDFVSMSGATRNRQALVDQFQNDPNCRVFLMTLKTGGTGLNLTAADTIFIFDPWWNVAAENQAIDRAHRIGQTNKVIAYKLIVQHSIEEKILELQEMKKELFDNVITSDSSSLKSLSEEDIDFILS